MESQDGIFLISYCIFSVFKRVLYIFISLYWLMMVAIMQLKASKLIVCIVSFTVVIFTILNDISTHEM